LCIACDRSDAPPDTEDGASDTASDTADEEASSIGDSPPVCVPAADDEPIQYWFQPDDAEHYCGPAPCLGADSCGEPIFDDDWAPADDEAARCVIEHLRDRKPGEYAFTETDHNLYSYRTTIAVYEGGLAIEHVFGSGETESSDSVRSGTLRPAQEYADCLADDAPNYAGCMTGLVGEPVTRAQLTCPR